MTHEKKISSLKAGTALFLAIAATASLTAPATAQEAETEYSGLGEIIVTAQKRAQNIQDVPIAITAITGDTLAANRIVSVGDLSSMAPGMTVSEGIGGNKLPSFSMRGAVSFGVVPGTDKQISTYIDGVYLSAGRGGMFNLPNLEAIEILRGPQGTLFGRNATGGAISIRTRDPDGEFGVKVSGTVGNQNEYGFKLGVDLPQVGPFSAYVSYVRDHRRGDVRNIGTLWNWDRTASAVKINRAVERSAAYLGSTDSHSAFAAVKFETGDFTTVYKFDWNKDDYSAQANLMTGVNTAFPGVGPFLGALTTSQSFPVIIATDAKRPKYANNTRTVPAKGRASGHSVTSTLGVSDRISLKNIFAYRVTKNFAASSVSGIDGLPITAQAAPLLGLPASLVGQPFVGVGTQANYRSRQISNEFQINYDSDFLTAVAGGLYFLGKDNENDSLLQPSTRFSPVVGGIITPMNIGRSFNRGESLAGYGQFEVHLTPQFDLILGGRVTRDNKSGHLDTGATIPTIQRISFENKDTRFTYLLGANYKPNRDTLLYGKYSTAFVSGGTVAGIPFAAETVKSFEVGAKVDLFDRRLRTNIALYHAKYDNVQYSAGSSTFADLITQLTGDPTRASKIQSFILNPGTPLIAKGIELDITAAPTRGLTFGGTLGYTDAKYDKPADILQPLLATNGGQFLLISRPKWVGSVFFQYDTPQVIDTGYVSFRIDTSFQSRKRLLTNPDVIGAYAHPARYQDSYATLNGRIALRDLSLGGAKAEFALWGKNITNQRAMSSAYDVRFAAVANFIKARAYGFDVTFEY